MRKFMISTMKPLATAFCGVWCLTSLSARAESPADVEALMGWMTGQFSSAAQVQEDSSARLRYVFGTRVNLPNIPGESMYLEWHAGAPDGPIDSQRIWSYEAKGDYIEMKFYTFYEKADAALTGILSAEGIDHSSVAALTMDDFHTYPDECTFTLYRTGDVIEGKNGTGKCRIFNRSLDVWMLPDVTMRLEPGRIWEAGTYVYERENGGQPPETLSVVQDFRRLR